MARKNEPSHFDLPLIQKTRTHDDLMARMRGKLAGGSMDEAKIARKQRAARRGKAFGWAWKAVAALILVAANGWLMESRKAHASAAAAKEAPKLALPSDSLSLNDQALFWAYALYDFDALHARYGTPKTALVDAGAARLHLQNLLPRVDEKTRFAIQRYLPRSRKT